LQHVVQPRAMDRVLRVRIARIAAERLRMDELAEPVVEDRFAQ
jgi:hypothetical protein